ncbi:putative E3 ubiquitin-protein ligase UBR7 isoform X2 [Boleophthalmus pectinirostris]|uniref:putative E3 ubiquitin-protein ligase UBR7 isoform X2 n=1 Tax=Boleophthalmus pectinirostris TaxID=150288 RepID=UPI000A1C283B|nr:putative E3 ubiquitin-protein ligase UBR7 isoform X2 [Boleophthalmus pectinirostris]
MAENNANQNGHELEVVDEAFLEQALCILAGSDSENCSYPQGYVKRQAVFACMTCTSNPDKPAGVCLACVNKCHDDHDIVELFTKRNFRCDCGNSKFGEFKCQLIPTKDAENVKNQYNHNYHGSYCTCDRPYPDPDGQDSDEMIQCVICEDWYHSRHLGGTVLEPEDLQDMVCEGCMNKAPFLWTYAAHYAVPPVVDISSDNGEEEVDREDDKKEAPEPSQSVIENPSPSETNATQKVAENKSSSCKRKREEETSGSLVQEPVNTVGCRLKLLEALAALSSQAAQRPREGAVFWPHDWRRHLCTCTSCKRAYVSAQVQFLMDPSDTMLAYENKGLKEPFGQNPLLALTVSMDRAVQLELIYGVQEMTTRIAALEEQCAKEGKEVTGEAVRQCFEEIKERYKRRRTNNEEE